MASALVIPVQWLEYRPFRDRFAALLDPALYTADWLDQQILSEEFTLFKHGNSAILTSLRVYPTGHREMHIEAAVGEMSHLTGPIIAEAEKWAKEQGCSSVSFASKAGWSRIMKNIGYSVYQVACRKEFS